LAGQVDPVMRWVVAWTAIADGGQPPPSPEVEVRSVEELDQRLDEIDAESRRRDPWMVDLYDAEASELPSLTIGVGADQSVVCWTVPDARPGSMVSRGGGDGDSEIWFASAGRPSYFSGDQLVSKAQAREAMRIFMRARHRPDNVEWEEI
jgi:hypothetical protein